MTKADIEQLQLLPTLQFETEFPIGTQTSLIVTKCWYWWVSPPKLSIQTLRQQMAYLEQMAYPRQSVSWALVLVQRFPLLYEHSYSNIEVQLCQAGFPEFALYTCFPRACGLSPTVWHRSSGQVSWPSSCRDAAGLSCSSIPGGTSPSRDTLTPQTFSSSWQILQCLDPDCRTRPWMKAPRKCQRLLF